MDFYPPDPPGTIENAMAETIRMIRTEPQDDATSHGNITAARSTARPRGRIPKSRMARPHSHLYRTSGRKSKGGKHSRRWENSQFMMRYVDEEDELLVEDIVPEHCSALTSLFTEPRNMEMWTKFVNRTEDEQSDFLSGMRSQHITNELSSDFDITADEPDSDPEKCYQRISRKIRSILRNRHLPLATLKDIEEELLHCFESCPDGVTIMLIPNSFDRLLLHAVCHYFQLQSNS
ncbi:R3H domain-containing protein 4-like isoform X2 [Corticium candelabrum]|uniref:R3H domain-containing protein 4-like isoform X2 n=1 Tax=Corticium candelabrum TaxID=121492 RepID=UPI002E259D92|nr:R3H domain-containing protein 4-like isoform X2 [Corticium candelabrum]